MTRSDVDWVRVLTGRAETNDDKMRRFAKEIPPLKRKIEAISLAIHAIGRPLNYMGETLYPRVISDPDAAIKVTAYAPAPVDRAIIHRGGYRTAPLARVSPAPRRGFRALAYLGNDLALRARPASLRRLAWAWIIGTMIRLWWIGRTTWREVSFLGEGGGSRGLARVRPGVEYL